jgi:hypothetical protein
MVFEYPCQDAIVSELKFITRSREAEAIAKASNKVSHYGTTLVILIRDFGRDLIGESEMLLAPEYTTTLQMQLGFTGPSVTVGIQK